MMTSSQHWFECMYHVCMEVFIWNYYMHVCMFVCIYECWHVCMYACMHAFMYGCIMYLCKRVLGMHVNIYMMAIVHIYIYI